MCGMRARMPTICQSRHLVLVFQVISGDEEMISVKNSLGDLGLCPDYALEKKINLLYLRA